MSEKKKNWQKNVYVNLIKKKNGKFCIFKDCLEKSPTTTLSVMVNYQMEKEKHKMSSETFGIRCLILLVRFLRRLWKQEEVANEHNVWSGFFVLLGTTLFSYNWFVLRTSFTRKFAYSYLSHQNRQNHEICHLILGFTEHPTSTCRWVTLSSQPPSPRRWLLLVTSMISRPGCLIKHISLQIAHWKRCWTHLFFSTAGFSWWHIHSYYLLTMIRVICNNV